jgi:hypothetical protein
MIFILQGGCIIYSYTAFLCSNTLGGSRFSGLLLAFSLIDRCITSSYFVVHRDGPIT